MGRVSSPRYPPLSTSKPARFYANLVRESVSPARKIDTMTIHEGTQGPVPQSRPFRTPRSDWWNPERVEKLRCLWGLKNEWNRPKFSATEIGGLLGISRSAIIGKAHRLKLEARAPTGGRPDPNIPRPPRKKRPVLTVVAQEEPDMSVARPSNESVGLVDLENAHCRYIVAQDEKGLARYCGAPKAFGSYCAYHAKMCYNLPPQMFCTSPA